MVEILQLIPVDRKVTVPLIPELFEIQLQNMQLGVSIVRS